MRKKIIGLLVMVLLLASLLPAQASEYFSFHKGATSQSVDFHIWDSSSNAGAGKTGLVYNSTNFACYYTRGATGTPTQIILATQTTGGAYTSGGFVERDSTHDPGEYRLDIPDAALASGVDRVRIQCREETTTALNVVPAVLNIDLTDVDLRAANGAVPVSGDLTSTMKTSVENAVWDASRSSHVSNGSFGQREIVVRSGTAQAGTATTITLDASASATDNAYLNAAIMITGGTGAGQVPRQITGYVGATKVATVDTAWTITPDNTSVFMIPLSYFASGGGGGSAPTAAQNAQAVWDQLTANNTTANSFGMLVKTALPNIAPGSNGGLPTTDVNNAVKVQSGTGANQISLSGGKVLLQNDAICPLCFQSTGTISAKSGTTLTVSGGILADNQYNNFWMISVYKPSDGSTEASSCITGTTLSSLQVVTREDISALITVGDKFDFLPSMACDNLRPITHQNQLLVDANGRTDLSKVNGSAINNLIGGRVDAQVGAYASGQDPATSVLTATASSFNSAGTIGAKINAAGTAGDPWATALPGSYGAGTAGNIIGNNLNATVSSRMATFTLPANFSSLSIDGSGRVDLGKTLGTAITLDSNNVLNVSAKYMGGTLLTARDIGASVLLSNGIGTGQIALSSGNVSIADDGIGPKAVKPAGTITAKSGTTLTLSTGITTDGQWDKFHLIQVYRASDRAIEKSSCIESTTFSTLQVVTREDISAFISVGDYFDIVPAPQCDNLRPVTHGNSLSVDANGRTDLAKINGSAINNLIGGRVDANMQAAGAGVINSTVAPNLDTTVSSRQPSGNVTVGAYASGQDPATSVLTATASGFNSAGTIGAKINAAGTAGDPWATPLPGSYGSGTAGNIIGNNINATIASRQAAGNVTVGGYASGQDPATSVLNATATSFNSAGTIGSKINSAGSAGDPLATAVPGAYAPGTAGYLIGNYINAAINSRMAASSYTAPDNATIALINGYLCNGIGACNAPSNTGLWDRHTADTGTLVSSSAFNTKIPSPLTFTAGLVRSQIGGLDNGVITNSKFATNAIDENASGLPTGAVVAGGSGCNGGVNSATVFATSLNQTAPNAWKSPQLIKMTSGNLSGQNATINGYALTAAGGCLQLVSPGLTGTPQVGDTFAIVNK